VWAFKEKLLLLLSQENRRVGRFEWNLSISKSWNPFVISPGVTYRQTIPSWQAHFATCRFERRKEKGSQGYRPYLTNVGGVPPVPTSAGRNGRCASYAYHYLATHCKVCIFLVAYDYSTTVMVEWLTLLFRIWEVPGSDFGWVVYWFYSVSPGKCRHNSSN
jgi:hypothetical protein